MIASSASNPQTGIAPEPSAGFASLLRDRTQTVHREAERSGYIADLLRGRATRLGYATYLYNLVPAYAAMEARLIDATGPFWLDAFASRDLFRTDALRHDIQAIVGDAPLRLLPEAEAYAAAVDLAAAGEGIGLVAHAYARYLGDLSGGQILKPLLHRTLGLEPDELTVYDFPGIVDIAARKAALRDALDTIDPASVAAPIVIAESIAAFRHTIAVSSAVSDAMTGRDPDPRAEKALL